MFQQVLHALGDEAGKVYRQRNPVGEAQPADGDHLCVVGDFEGMRFHLGGRSAVGGQDPGGAAVSAAAQPGGKPGQLGRVAFHDVETHEGTAVAPGATLQYTRLTQRQ